MQTMMRSPFSIIPKSAIASPMRRSSLVWILLSEFIRGQNAMRLHAFQQFEVTVLIRVWEK